MRRPGHRFGVGALLGALLVPLLVLSAASPSSAEVFPSTPRYVRSIGGQGRPGAFAWGVQFNPVTNEILVADYLHFKIRRYDLQGNHLGDFWRPDPIFGQPYTIGVDPRDGAIYVTELKDNPITTGIAKYDKAGNFLYANQGVLNVAPEHRAVSDAVTTAGSTTITSATARFNATDVGAKVTGAGIPAGATIVSRTTSAAVLSQAATATATGVTVDVNPFPTAFGSSFRAFYTVWMTVEEDTGDIFVLDSHYTNFVGERPRVLQLRFDDATKSVSTVDAWAAIADNTPLPDNGDGVQDPGECTNPVGCDPRMYGIDIVTAPGQPTDDMIYVTDAYNRRNMRFRKNAVVKPNGVLSHWVDTYGAGVNGGDNRGIVVNEATNRVYSVDAENSQVDVFTMGTATAAPTYVSSFGSEGRNPGQFTGGGRAIDLDANGNVWVADFGGFEVEEYTGAGAPLRQAPAPAAKPPGGLLGQPRDVAVDDATGEVWVADAWNQRFQRFSATGQWMGSFGFRGPGGPFDMNYPRHIAVQAANTAAMPGTDHPKRIWVSNERGHHLQVYNAPTNADPAQCNGATGAPVSCSPTYVAQVGEIGRDDIEANHFRWPVDIEFSTRPGGIETVVVGDRMASSVKVFNATTFQEILNPLDTTPSDGQPMIARPNHGVAVDPANGNILVVNPSNDRVELYDQNGVAINGYTSGTTAVNYFGSAAQNGNVAQLRDPVDAVVKNGIIYVSDEGLSRVVAFSLANGAKLGQWGSTYGSNIYDFKGAIGIDVRDCSCAEDGYLYVTDTYNDRIQVFNPNLPRQVETTVPAAPVVSTPAQAQANLTTLGAVSFTGTASDGTAVGQVEVSVQDYVTKLWWDANTQSWETTKSAAIAGWSGATATNVNWRWTFLGVSAQGRYVAEFKTRDHNANLSTVVVRTFAMPGATAPPLTAPPVLDTTRPDAVQSTPAASQVLPLADVGFTGTATDNVGVADVRIGIKRVSDGRWLQNLTSTASTAFGTTFKTFGAADGVVLGTPGGTSTTWSFTWPNERAGDYQTYVEARDAAGNVDNTRPQVNFTVSATGPDTTAPETVLSAPAPGSSSAATPVVVSGSATDDQSVAGVALDITNAAGQHWTGTTWSAAAATVQATLATPSTPTSTWSYSFQPPASGTFAVAAVARDASGGLDATPATTSFTVTGAPADTTAPDTAVTTPAQAATVAAGTIAINGSATDNVGVTKVEVSLYDRTRALYWNGSAWVTGFRWVPTAATLATPGAPSTTWSFTWNKTGGSGSYRVQTRATDVNGNVETTFFTRQFSQA